MAKKHKKQDSAAGPAPSVRDADAPKRHIGTELPTVDYDAVERYTDYTDEWVDAAVPALEGLREFYLQMEERPAFNVFAVAVVAHLLTWTADALTEDDDLLSPV